MKILGIDPGTATTGWSLIEPHPSQDPVLIAAGIITTSPNEPLATRLVVIHDNLDQLIKQYQPDQLAIEKIFFARNVTTAISVSQARGVILLTAAQHQLTISEYTPLQVKLAIVGYGRATKNQINQMLKNHLRQGTEIPKQDDAADAIAVAITHIISLGNNMMNIISKNEYQK